MKRKLAYLLSVMLLLSVISYGAVRWYSTSYGSNSAESNDDIKIVTSFYPMYIAAMNITEGIEGIQLVNLTENQTGCVHDYQLTTKDMRTISDADIAIINGGEMEEFMEEVIANYPSLKVITASEGMDFLTGSSHNHTEEEHDHEEDAHTEEEHDHEADAHTEEEHDHEADAHAEEEHDHEAGHTHEHSDINGHVWMNMDLYQQQIAKIADQLAEYDVEHKDIYQENAQNYIAKIEALKAEFADLWELANGTEVIIFHDAFAYLAQELGMEVVYTVNTDSESALSAGEIAEVIEEINLHSIRFLFTEEQYSTAIADAVAAETDARVYVMDSLVTGKIDPDAYLNGMRKNLEALQTALADGRE